MKKIFLVIIANSFALFSNSQILKNTELTFSPFGVNTLGMNSSMDWQYGFRTDVLTYGGVFINGVNAWFDDNARRHEYFYLYPNVNPARSIYDEEAVLKKNKKKFFELGYFYPVLKWGSSSRLLGRVGYFKTRNAFSIAEADEPNDGTGTIKNPFYGINVNGTDSIQFGPFGRESEGYYSTGYGIMRSSGGYVGISLNHTLPESSSDNLAITYDLYCDFLLGSVKFDDLYLVNSGGVYSPTGYAPYQYKLYNSDIHKTGYRIGLNFKIPAQKMAGFYFNFESGKRPGYVGYDKNQRAYFQFLMGVSIILSKEKFSELNPF